MLLEPCALVSRRVSRKSSICLTSICGRADHRHRRRTIGMFILFTPTGLCIAIRYGGGLAIQPRALSDRPLVNWVRIGGIELLRSGMLLIVGFTDAAKFS
jgi:hypothetical protein